MPHRNSLIALAAALLLAACGKDQGGPPPPQEVSIITLKPRAVQITDQLPGRTTAFRVAEVRPQVTGVVQKRLFAEGTEVKAGEQLFQIDAGSYRADDEWHPQFPFAGLQRYAIFALVLGRAAAQPSYNRRKQEK